MKVEENVKMRLHLRFAGAYKESAFDYEAYQRPFSEFKNEIDAAIIGLLLTSGSVETNVERTSRQRVLDFCARDRDWVPPRS